MSEEELRARLRAAVAGEPPLRFDADALIRRAQAVRKRRRALTAVAVATAALTATVLSLPGALSAARGPTGVDALDQVLTTTATSAAPAPAPAPVSAVPVGRLADYLAARFGQVVPGALKVHAEFTDTRREQVSGYVTGFVRFVDRDGTGGVAVQLSAPPFLVTRDDFCAGVRCDAPRRQPDGSYLEFATSSSSGHDRVSYSVAHFRTDGSVAQVSAYNYDPAGGKEVRPTVPLTTDQLVALATDPNLDAG